MRPEKVFKRYDVRGKYPEEIDEKFAHLLGKSLGSFAKRNFEDRVAVCRDNKESSDPLKDALIEGLLSAGVEVIDIGEGPTDFCAWSGKMMGCVSVQVTSSHMPLNFNGFKFLYPEGNGFVNEDLYQVQDIFRRRDFESGKASVQKKPELIEEYMDEIVDFAQDRGSDFNVKAVVESMGGAGKILPELLEMLGVEVVDISDSERPYMDPPYPKPENLGNLKKAVEEHEADIGFGTDLDADRLTVYREGEFVSGDEILCVLSQLVDGPVVASVDTSKALNDIIEVENTRVGDPFVMSKAIEIDAELAGEPNGHYAFTDFVPYSSGLLTALILAGLDLEQMLDKVPDYAVKRESVNVEDKKEVIEKLKQQKNEIISDLDGAKFREGDAEVLVRPSGSSPKVRIISESKNEGLAEKALKNAQDTISRF